MFNTQFNLEVFSEFVMIIYEAWVAIFHSLLIHHGGNWCSSDIHTKNWETTQFLCSN